MWPRDWSSDVCSSDLYLVGIEADPGTKVGSNVAHSVVSFFAGAQPTGGLECSVAFGVNVPNQQTSLCNGSYGFYQGGPAQYNFLASKVGIGTPFPSQMLDVAGNINASGCVVASRLEDRRAGHTSLNPTNIAAGTAGISITGNAATLGGIAPSGYAPASGSARYVAK